MRAVSFAIFLLCASAARAFALEVKVMERDGEVIQISSSEPNLIEAAEGRITSFVFSDGMFTQTIDPDAGVVYFRPLQQGPRAGFVEMLDDEGRRHRFALVLVPQDQIEARRIVLEPGQPERKGLPSAYPLVSQSHVEKVKEFLRKMLEAPEQGSAILEADPQRIGAVLLRRLRVWHGAGLIGERFRLVNSTSNDYQVNEASIQLGEGVVAVAAAQSVVAAGASTDIFMIRFEPGAGR